MKNNEYDLLIIGAGSAGNSAAFAARKKDKKVGLIEKDFVGGTCTNYGCDPTKRLLHIAQLYHDAQQMDQFGLDSQAVSANWTLVQHLLEESIAEIRGGSEEEIKSKYDHYGIDLIRGKAVFVDPHTVRVDDREYSADQIMITAGSKPLIPPITGLETVGFLTNRDAVFLPHLPASLLIIGAGPVGTEFAQLFQRFGVQVMLVDKGEMILGKDDHELAGLLKEVLEDEGVDIELQADVVQAKFAANGRKEVTLRYKSGYESEIAVDDILIAAGRAPDFEEINLAAAGVEQDENGWIVVNEYLQTSTPHIWAAGDVTGEDMFTHFASRQGDCVGNNAFADSKQSWRPGPSVWTTFTSPALAHAGLTIQQLEKEGIPFTEKTLDVKNISRATLEKRSHGRLKLLFGEDQKLLGGHVLSHNAGDIIGTVILALNTGAGQADLANSIFPYPTFVEGLGMTAKS